VKHPSDSSYITLSPRQQITSTPYAIRSATAGSAETATNATQLGGAAASEYVLTGDSRLSDARTPTAGSANYIQNGSNQQASSNFNISGNGNAAGSLSGNIVNATTQYNLNGTKFLGASSSSSFFGLSAGQDQTDSGNTFVGFRAGMAYPHGNNATNSTVIGANAVLLNPQLDYATAIGASAIVRDSHTIVLGTSAETTQIPGSLQVTGTVGIDGTLSANTVNAQTQYNVNGVRAVLVNQSNVFLGIGAGPTNVLNSSANTLVGFGVGGVLTGAENSFFGYQAGAKNERGTSNAFFGEFAGAANTDGNSNAFFGSNAGAQNTIGTANVFIGDHAGGGGSTGSSNTFIGSSAGTINSAISSSTAIGSGASVLTDHTIVLGTSAETTQIPGSLEVTGTIAVDSLSAANTSLCANAWKVIVPCSSSLRYKTNVQSFLGGLGIINRLRPISFDWKQGGLHDLGFGAEEVAQIEPLLTFKNDKGEIEGVKYSQLSAVFVNAFKEQQTQIAQQQQDLASLRTMIDKQQQQLKRLKRSIARRHVSRRRS
jgi:carbonic anhydrase/acetyltransferase-like protein (isoleucine patch superfamily)